MKLQLAVAVASVSLLVGSAHAQAPAAATAGGAVELKKEGPPRFYGLSFDYSLFDGTGLNADSYNNSLSMYFEPTWAFGHLVAGDTRWRTLNLAGRFALTVPLAGYDEAYFRNDSDLGPVTPCSDLQTSSNGTVDPNQVKRCPTSQHYRGAIPGDTWLTLSNPKLFTVPGVGVSISPSLRVILPTSIESQFATLRAATSGSVRASRPFFGDRLTVGYSFGATKYFHSSTTPVYPNNGRDLPAHALENNVSYTSRDVTPAFTYTTPGGYNPSFGFTHVFSADLKATEKLSFNALYILVNSFAYEAQCGTQQYGNVMTDPCANANTVAMTSNGVGTAGRKHSDTQVFWFTVAYQVNDWLGLSVAWINWAPLRKPDNSYRQGVVSTNYDAFTTLSFGATFSIDKAAAKLF